MNQFEVIIIGLLLTMVFGMFVIGKWVMVMMINSRLINRKIEQRHLIDLELRFFRFLHFNGEKEEGSKYYLGKIIKTFRESKRNYFSAVEYYLFFYNQKCMQLQTRIIHTDLLYFFR